ncbi:zinc finger matrin-type protein CG9776 [Contarinia nasturtii]|uniref:zinc finger matrin-type protein CG9776 n=1 Tax=Contarinia nasturtii TaxID=265458 RepID=UPI0012D40609|nr:zinc finger matrin-type protein CG9776 [Contarinia nasturtii]
MDDKIRSSGNEPNDGDDSQQKTSRRRRTPSAEPSDRNDGKTKRKSRSRSVNSHSRSPSRDRSSRRRRSRSRGHYSPDRRYGRQFNRGGYQRDFYNRRRQSRSPGFRGRNRNARRSRSTSFDRYRNRRNASSSRERSQSQGRENSRAPAQQPPPPPPTAAATNYPNDYAPTHFQPEFVAQHQSFPNAQPFGNYDYHPMMQPPPTSFPAYPPPTQDYVWNAQVPPPPIISCAPAASDSTVSQPVPTLPINETDEEQQKRQAAIAAEKKIQRDTIRKQRDDYICRASALKRELITLKEQREELTGDVPPSPTTNGFILQNDRLQAQIENKISTIENVIEMLNGILSADKSDNESPKKLKVAPKQENSDDSSPERLKTKLIESLTKKRKGSERSRKDEKSSKSAPIPPVEQINFTFFDPEQHWCKACSTFPKTAKEYLLHLHSDEHKNNVKPPEIPWHEHLVKDDMPTYPNAATKRTPIRGLQFFVPSTAWYCKLCSIWIGDLHCASSHLKSQTHAREYEKFIVKNPLFENEWLEERQKAFDVHREKEKEQSQKVIAPPSPPKISSQKSNSSSSNPTVVAAPPPPHISPYGNAAANRLFDGIPLQINQRTKDLKEVVALNEETVEKKKGKKKKKEKKKRKKSKKKHRHSSSSSSSSSEESSISRSPERKESNEKIIDSTTSIRVAMRNAVNAVPARAHLKPKSDDEETPRDTGSSAGGWTVVQPEPKAIAPKAPTISANGEAQNRRDEAMLSQWTPLPVISDQEKQLFEQLKGKMKNREEKKKDKTPPPTIVHNANVQLKLNPPQQQNEDTTDRSSMASDRRRNDSDQAFKEVKEKDRRDTYRKRRSRSPSSPYRDWRSPRRDRRKRSRTRSRSLSPRRDRRYSRSPRRDRRRDSRYSRSRSRDRHSEKSDLKSDKNTKASDKKSNAAAKKAATIPGKKLPFIGRMPVFKKQSTEDESKKQDLSNDISEEEKMIKKKKQDELKFQIHQKQQMLQLQQKQAEAYNLAHPGQFANIYNTHGIHGIILPTVQPEEYDLMPDPTYDPMQYAMMTAAPPPPMPEPVIPHFEEQSEPVLPPGIDEEEAENMELEAAVPPPPPPSDRGNLPKDFQDALSIIFDKGAENQSAENVVAAPADHESPSEGNDVVMQDDASNFVQMDMSSDSHQPLIEQDQSNGAVLASTTSIEMDEQSQYALLYADDHYAQNHVQQSIEPSLSTTIGDLSTQNIPTPPIQILDAAGNLTKIPGPVLEVSNNFVMLDPDGNRIDDPNTKYVGTAESEHEIEMQKKRQQELDDLAMLGIDADDLAAQQL